MALHTQTQFAALCGVTAANLSTYKKRGKVVVNAQSYIDDTDPTNAAFLKKRLEMGQKEVKQQPTHKNLQQPAQISTQPDTNTDFSARGTAKPATSTTPTNIFEIDKKLKLTDIELKERRIRLLQIEEAIKMGKLLPNDPVQKTFISFSENLKIAYQQGSERLIVVLTQKKALTAEEQADIRNQLTAIINQSLADAITQTKKDLREKASQAAKPKTDLAATGEDEAPATQQL